MCSSGDQSRISCTSGVHGSHHSITASQPDIVEDVVDRNVSYAYAGGSADEQISDAPPIP